MIIRVSELDEQGLRIDDVAALAPGLSDPSWRLHAVSLEVEAEGTDVFVRGRVAVDVPQTCGRCADVFPLRLETDVDARLVPRPLQGEVVELGAKDLDLDFYTNDELDLTRIVETETSLALPMKSLCRSVCRGLCPVCGVNRNDVPCACASRPPDPRLAVLRDFATRLSN
jgi:uncharacterized protein